MADDIQKKVLIDVQIADEDANSALQDLKTKIDALNGAVINSKVTMSDAKAATAALTAELAKGKIEQQNVKTAIDKARLAQLEANIATKEAKKNMVAASGSYAEAQQKLTALGKAIKNTEGGFKSQDAAIKAQIADYNKLNSQLKAFDTQMGNHQRNVGNYEKALGGVTQQLSSLIPGFGKFQSILQSASDGFNAMGKGAVATEEGMEGAEVAAGGLSVAAGAVAAAFAVVTVAVAGTITYLSQFQNYADRFQKTKAGIGAQLNQIGQDFANLDFHDFFAKIKEAGDQASDATGKLQMMGRDAQNAITLTDNENAQLGVMMKKFRDRATSATEATKIHGEALKILNTQYGRNNDLAVDSYNAMIDAELAGKGFSDEQIASLRIQSGEVAGLTTDYTKLTNIATNFVEETQANGAQAGKDFLEKLNQGMQGVIATNSQLQNQKQLFANRDDAKQAKAEAAAEKEKNLQAEIARATEQANNDRMSSISKMLEFEQYGFALELSKTDEHYRQLIFKQKEFIEKQEQIANNKKHSPKTRALAHGAIKAAQNAITAINNEHYAEQEHALQEHSKRMLVETQRAANELAHAQIASISDAEEKEKQSLNLAYRERIQTLNTQANEIAENEAKLANEINDKIKPPTAERLAILKAELDHEKSLYAKNRDEATEATEEFQQKQTDSLKKYISERKILTDQLATISAARKKGFGGGNDNPFNKSLENAQVAEAQDSTQSELQNAGLDGDKNKDGSEFSKTQLLQKQKIAQQGEDVVTKIKKDATKKRTDMEVDAAKQVADASFQIIQQSMERSFQNQQVMLNRAKDHDLQNQALTSTQKYAIQEKYRKKEGALKVKQFKQEQELALVKGVIDTASAVIKASPNPVLMALAAITGAIEIGVIASQKAPAYAKGGIHYDSDGKGGVLPGYSKTDNMNARLRSGEGIVVSEAMRDPWAKSVVSAINQSYGGRSFDSTAPVNWSVPGFASGGVYKNYLPTGDNGLRPQINVPSGGRMHPDDITGIANAVSRLPAPLMDIKDVNFAQNKLASAVDRLNY